MDDEMLFIEDENVGGMTHAPEGADAPIENACMNCEEISALQSRIEMLVKDNAELISDNLALRAKVEALLEARAALPEFSVKTEMAADKYSGIREIFKNANSSTKRK